MLDLKGLGIGKKTRQNEKLFYRSTFILMAERVGFEPTIAIASYDELATRSFQPTHAPLRNKYKNRHLI